MFEGHNHYVMQITINPKDTNTFASASLDRTIKVLFLITANPRPVHVSTHPRTPRSLQPSLSQVWSLNSATCNYTLEGHDKGVNCLDYYPGGEKPYLVSGADDKYVVSAEAAGPPRAKRASNGSGWWRWGRSTTRLVKVWDYQNKTCVQTLESHTQNVSVVCFHPELPIIVSGSEDGTVRIWHANTYRLENTLNYGMERVWALGVIRGSNDVAIAYDEGTVVIKVRCESEGCSERIREQAGERTKGRAEERRGERKNEGMGRREGRGEESGAERKETRTRAFWL